MMSIGAKGMISVTSNITPHSMIEIVHPALKGDFISATGYKCSFEKLFSDAGYDDTRDEPNPSQILCENTRTNAKRCMSSSIDYCLAINESNSSQKS